MVMYPVSPYEGGLCGGTFAVEMPWYTGDAEVDENLRHNEGKQSGKSENFPCPNVFLVHLIVY